MATQKSKHVERIVFAIKALIEGDDSIHFVAADFPEGEATERQIERALTAAKGKVLAKLGVDQDAAAGSSDLDFDLWLLATLRGRSIDIDEDNEPCMGLTVESHALIPYSDGMEWEEANWAIGEAYKAEGRQDADGE